MLKRYAFLVGSTKGNTSLPAAREDLILMGKYLMSNVGGGWEKNELRICLNHSAFDILDRVDWVKRQHPDYFLFYWSGHGYANDQSQMLKPSGEEAVALECFHDVAYRQLMILDTCREYTRSLPSVMEASFTQAVSIDSQRQRCRRVYDHYIAECEPSLQIAYACQAGGKAKARRHGGSLFTTTLVDRALRWELPSRRRYGFASIRRLMGKPFSNGEHPGYYHSGSGVKTRCFPFAVGAYC